VQFCPSSPKKNHHQVQRLGIFTLDPSPSGWSNPQGQLWAYMLSLWLLAKNSKKGHSFEEVQNYNFGLSGGANNARFPWCVPKTCLVPSQSWLLGPISCFVLGIELYRVMGNQYIILIRTFHISLCYIQKGHPWRHGDIMNFGLGLEYFLGLESKTCSITEACPTRGVKPPCPSHLQVGTWRHVVKHKNLKTWGHVFRHDGLGHEDTSSCPVCIPNLLF